VVVADALVLPFQDEIDYSAFTVKAPPPSPCTNWTCLVLPPVLSGHVKARHPRPPPPPRPPLLRAHASHSPARVRKRNRPTCRARARAAPRRGPRRGGGGAGGGQVAERELPRLPAIIAAISPAQLRAKQRALPRAWPALTYQRRGGAVRSARLGGPGAGGAEPDRWSHLEPDAFERAFLELARRARARGGTPHGFWT
jgi:hypothetical protein